MDINTQEKLRQLRRGYFQQLPHKIEDVAALWCKLRTESSNKDMQQFHRLLHNLCGSAGTFGFLAVSHAAKELEDIVKTLLNGVSLTDGQKTAISDLINHLKHSLLTESSESDFFFSEEKPSIIKKNKLIYFFDRDQSLFDELYSLVNQMGYKLTQVNNFTALQTVLNKKTQTIGIINANEITDSDITLLQNTSNPKNIFFFVAKDPSLTTRIKSAQAGATSFLTKPINKFNLTNLLETMINFAGGEPPRILILDDTESVADYYALMLHTAGIETSVITDPRQLFSELDEFRPHLLLIDLYMPNYNGMELAAAIRQDPRYTMLPIVFISTERDKITQSLAISISGGDDFITKPVLPEHLIAIVRSRLKRSAILNYYISTDSLTGLINHTNLLQCLNIEFSRTSRQQQPLSFAMIDIDHFKQVNDDYGHVVGDTILRTLTELLRTRLRKEDIIGRYGGDEFSLIMPNTDTADGINVIDDIRKKFSKMIHQTNGERFSLTLSAGIASYPALKSAHDILLVADKALYEAKSAGRNRVVASPTSKLS